MNYFCRIIFFVVVLTTSNNCSNLGSRWGMKKCSNSYNSSEYTGHYKIGKPYLVNDITYYPKYDPAYSEEGVASWYGDSFHCKQTANGEVFNKHQLSAAHRTLPLPSVVRVTNLKNGRSAEVVVNDRGPFVNNRIIDLSDKAADILGFKNQGTAKVRVEYLPGKTNSLLKQINSSSARFSKNSLSSNLKTLDAKFDTKPVTLTKISSGAVPEEYKILVGKFARKSDAMESVRNLSRMGVAKLVKDSSDNEFHVYFSGTSVKNDQKFSILKKIIAMGYQKAYLLG